MNRRDCMKLLAASLVAPEVPIGGPLCLYRPLPTRTFPLRRVPFSGRKTNSAAVELAQIMTRKFVEDFRIRMRQLNHQEWTARTVGKFWKDP